MHFCLNVIYNMSFQLCKNIVLHTLKILLIGTHDESLHCLFRLTCPEDFDFFMVHLIERQT